MLEGAHRHKPAVARKANDRVVGLRAARRRVNDHVDGLSKDLLQRILRKHALDVRGCKRLLQRVECQAREL